MKWDRENPYLFLEDWRKNDAEMEFEECLGQFQLKKKWGRQWTVTKSRGKNWNSFKKCLWNAKHAFFATETSRQGKPPKHLKSKFWKNFVSVFRDWKVYLWGSCELSRENLWVNLATRPSTREQVAKSDPRRRDWGSRLDIPVTEPPKQGKIGFLKFSDFLNKILSKNT